MKKNNQNKNIGLIAFCLLALVGTYNAVMINSESSISAGGNFKRLDEMYGVVKSGRSLAVATDWRKVTKTAAVAAVTSTTTVSAPTTAASEVAAPSEASINEELSLKLVDVINAKKWATGVKADQFSGSIQTNNGIIESLVAALPGNNTIDIAFSEMNGNVFEYDLGGEVFSGMMYQVDQSAYMVTLTNGPLEGTRMRFVGEAKDSEVQKSFLAETHNVEVQDFGSEAPAPEVQATEATVQVSEVSSFNFNI